jgi:hypothetical protein
LAVNLYEKVSRKMRDTASEALALPFEEAEFSLLLFSLKIQNPTFLFLLLRVP